MTGLHVAGLPPARPGAALLAVSSLDDRREIWHLLHRLSPRDRAAFLSDCCRRVPHGTTRPSWHRLRPLVEAAYRDDAGDRRLTDEVYGDLAMLAATLGFDLLAAAVRLEALVRRGGRAG